MIDRNPLPSQIELRRLFSYDGNTGILSWNAIPERLARHNKRWAGRAAGNLHLTGYLVVRLGNRRFYAHRLIWKWLYDQEPPSIDHKSGDGTNNREDNLRAASHFENMRNTPGWSKKALPKGVHPRPDSGRYRAIICVNQRNISVGTFDTVELAYAAYCEAASRLHGAFARVS